MTGPEQPGFDAHLAWGIDADLALAADHDVSGAVPLLAGGAFAQLSWPG